ncbi:toll/interleukin-1 receptor domain-containing protein [Saccharothrix australiensis]|uniref:SEFIR domain-containing protein n=1 Tax=Saccharothrix australiensis TaxID=2072 RepID=A0A495W2J6_9PSEU|nr:toll/interleukin-1 receptor domain-containing protein [Saccharothrix australiensis]RKT55360.1 SEFIR domain-containing protein [Saccharothrix australiensis]
MEPEIPPRSGPRTRTPHPSPPTEPQSCGPATVSGPRSASRTPGGAAGYAGNLQGIPEGAPALSPTVFVSYVHGTDEHKRQVLEFARFLRAHGVTAVLDRWTTVARKDWYPWIVAEILRADHVLAIASGPYRDVFDGRTPATRYRGSQAEAALLRELLHGDRDTWLPKILPVVLPGRHADEVPLLLQPHSCDRYQVTGFTESGAEDLLRVIHRKPKHIAPPVGPPPDLPPRTW